MKRDLGLGSGFNLPFRFLIPVGVGILLVLSAQGGLVTLSQRENPAIPLETGARWANSKEAADLLKQATEALSGGDAERCLDLLRKARIVDSAILPAEIALARLVAMSGNLEAASARLREVPFDQRFHPEALLLGAEISLGLGRFSEAEKELFLLESTLSDAASKLEDDALAAYRRSVAQGRLYLLHGEERWGELASLADRVLEVNPDEIVALKYAARAAFEKGEIEEASGMLERARKLDPSAELPGVVLHRLYAGKEKWEDAERELSREAHENLEEGGLQLQLASWYLSRGKLDFAEGALNSAKRAGCDPEMVSLVECLLEWKKGKSDRAASRVRLALGQFPESSQIRRWAAVILAESASSPGSDRSSALDEALELAESEMKESKGGAGALMIAGWVYFHRGDFADAEKMFLQSWKRQPGNPQLSYYMATLFARSDREEQSLALIEKVLSNDRPFLYRSQALALRDSLTGKAD